MAIPTKSATTCMRINTWTCAGTYSKCELVGLDGWYYGVTEDVTEPSIIEPTADPRFTRGMSFSDAVLWLVACGGCCQEPTEDTDTYGSVRANNDGSYTFINADGTDGLSWVGSAHPEDIDTYGLVRDNGNGTYTFIKADGTDGVTWVGIDTDTDTDTFGSVRDNGDGTYTFINADGTDGKTWCGECGTPCPDVSVGAIADQAINGGGEITISATADAGTDETIDTWAWTQTGGTAVALTGDTTSSISFTAPNETTTLTFEVTATNSCGNSATGTATVEATENVGPPPEFSTKAYSSIVVASPAPVLVCQQTYGSDEPGADQNLCSDEDATIELSVLNDTLSLGNVNIEYVSGINLGAGAYAFTNEQYGTKVSTSVFPAPSDTGLSTYRVWGTSDNGTTFDITRTVYLMPTGL